MATYGPGIDQSQHAKSVSHIIILGIYLFICKTVLYFQYFLVNSSYSFHHTTLEMLALCLWMK